jgi:hypothetical protein
MVEWYRPVVHLLLLGRGSLRVCGCMMIGDGVLQLRVLVVLSRLLLLLVVV